MSPKASDHDPSPSEEKVASLIAAKGQAQLNALTTANLRFVKEIEKGHRVWWESVQRTHDVDKELGSGLLQCNDPAQAAALYNEWMIKRVSRFMEDARDVSKLWFDLGAYVVQETTTSHITTSAAEGTGSKK